MTTIDSVWPRVLKCAEGGALATETQFELELINSAYNTLANDALAALLDRNLRAVGGVTYTPEEQSFAAALRETFLAEGLTVPAPGSETQILKIDEGIGYGSTDVADVSWLVPTAGFKTATFVPGSPGHSWQSTACAGMSIGRKGLMVAAKVLAVTALDLFTDPRELAAAKKSFTERKAGKEYRSRLPAEQKPPLNYRDQGN